MNPPIAYDLVSHHALSGGSYVFKCDYPSYLKALLPYPNARTEINIIIQPNCSPHIGTLCSLGLAFVVAKKMCEMGMNAVVTCDLWDRVNGEQLTINGLAYQRTLRDTGKFDQYFPNYKQLLTRLSERYGVGFKLRLEEEFLKSHGMSEVVRRVIQNRDFLAKYLAPEKGSLGIRAGCPQCGLVDKYGVNNVYTADASAVTSVCPCHGQFTYSTDKDTHHFMFNCQLFNLVLGCFYETVTFNYIEVCGSDYAGFWQEQLLWRFLSKPIVIVYTPLISDWSGSKISKSLYLQKTAYDYLKKAGQEYLLSYEVLQRMEKDLGVLWREIELWVYEPYRLFRGYSLHYFHLLFRQSNIELGVVQRPILEPDTE